MRKLFLLLLFPALLITSCSESTRFRLISPEHSGVEFANTITESDSFNVITYEYIYNGAGVGAGDLNNDGLTDLVFAGNMVSPKIYLNEGNFRFRDITANFEGLSNNQWYGSVTLVDINSDKWLDVFLTSTTDPDTSKCRDRLWVCQGTMENGDPWYKEMAEQYGIADDGQSTNAAFFDYDNDGDLDLYITINTINQRMNTAISERIITGKAVNNDRLFRNNGDGTFTNVTIPAGILYEGFGLGLAMGDVNKDGFTDIYVSNDFITNDLLYINQKDGTFKNEIAKYMSYQTRSSMGNDMADINNDGNPDMFTLDMLPEYYYKKRQTNAGSGYLFYQLDARFGFEHQYIRNMLHLHNGFMNGKMLPFSEVGQMAGVEASEWSWSPLFADYDNDGDKDLLIANGFPRDMTDKDYTVYKAKYFGYLADEFQTIEMSPPVKVQNFAFENRGDLNFSNVSKEWLPEIPSFSYGAAFADLDNDGDLDYVTNNINDKAFIMRNFTVEKSKKDRNYLKIKLYGSGSNTMAIGAKVELWSGGQYQFHEQFLTRGYASSVDPVIHFGIGDNTIVDSVRITWPAGGNVSVIKNIKAGQTIEADQKNAIKAVGDITGRQPDYIFEERPDLLDYLHEQIDFPDYIAGQNIIPHKFSQIGPRISTGDIDGDSLEDIIIGATNKLPTSVYLRKGEGFVKTDIKGLTTKKEFSEAGLAVADFDNDGDNDVVAVAGAYENQFEEEFKHYMYENRKGSFERILLPLPPFIASVVKPCDFDHDGDIDLFIGARVKNGMFPYSNKSWVLVNEKGKMNADPAFSFDLGMVTDAVWSDYDNDGWEDLIITREWNTIAVFRNENGKRLNYTEIPGFKDKHGLWYTVIPGDFDNDGDTDYIAGNLGQNHRFTISEQYPLKLYALDIEMDGRLDPVSTAWWKDQNDVMREYPINYLDELIGQSPYFQSLFHDYKSFSYATIDNIFDENLKKRIEIQLIVNTSSSYVIWNDNGAFRWEELPMALQVSPVTKGIVRDLNGDGFPDVILGGNDHTYDVSTGYYDANKGFVLISRGKEQGFDVLTPAQSGLLLNGMVESLLWIEGDTPLVVGGINREKAVVYKVK